MNWLARTVLLVTISVPSCAAAAVQGIQEVQSASAASAGPVSFPFANTAGNTIIVAVASGNAPISVTDTANNQYQLVSGSVNGSVSAYIASNVNGGTNSVSVNGITTWADTYIHEYAGLNSTSPVDQVATATGLGTAVATAPKTTTFPYELIFGFAFVSSKVTAVGQGFTLRETADGNATYDQIGTSQGTYTAPATQSSSSNYSALMITLMGASTSPPGPLPVNVTTYQYDNSRSGHNTSETVLTPANVNPTQFGKLFSVRVDGYVYAQPLYLSSVNIGGGVHNVVYVATEHDSVYAIDADSGSIYWRVSLIPAGGSTVSSSSDLACSDITPEVGITGTPVIDIGSGTIYLITKANVNSTFVQHLHALEIATGAEKFGGPVLIQASVPGTGDGSTTVSFTAFYHHSRPGLLLQNGHVLAAWASHCDHTPYHGWVMSYSAGSLAQEGVFATTPNGGLGGIWMSGAGLAGDANYNTYVATGNGSFDGTSNFGDSILKLGQPTNNTLPKIDSFTPFNQGSFNNGDEDLGSGGILLLPDLPSGSAHQHLLLQGGKNGTLYLVDRDRMGGFCSTCTSTDTQIVQELQNATAGNWSMAAYWNGRVYLCGSGEGTSSDALKAFSFNANNSGVLSPSPTSRTSNLFSYPGATPVVSANGTSNAIVWAIDSHAYGSSGPAVLHAYDATNVATELYNTNQNPTRDDAGAAVKFTVPVVANGKVYVGTQTQLSVFGLLSGLPMAATPTFNPAAGTYTSRQSVTISDSTAGAVIHYTTDGSTPTSSSTVYGKPIVVNSTTTIKAIAVAVGYRNSAVASGMYTTSKKH